MIDRAWRSVADDDNYKQLCLVYAHSVAETCRPWGAGVLAGGTAVV